MTYTYSEYQQAKNKAAATFFGIGIGCGIILVTLVWMACSFEKEKPSRFVTADDMVMVTIISRHEYKGKSWWLVEADDGQRGAIDVCRGKSGDRFLLTKDQIKGYKRIAPGTIEPGKGDFKLVKPGIVVPNEAATSF